MSSFQTRLSYADELWAAGRVAEAVAAYREVLASPSPDRKTKALVHYRLAKTLADSGAAQDAEAEFAAALDCDPTFVDAYLELGNALRKRGEAMEAINLYRRSMVHCADAGILVNLAAVLLQFGLVDQAEASARLALQMRPGFPDAHINLGNAHLGRGDVRLAVEEFARAVQAAPHRADAFTNLLFALTFDESADPEAVYRTHLEYNARFIVPLRPARRNVSPVRDPERKLRIGYVSGDFRRHAGGHFLRPLLDHHDHSRFDILAYSTSQGGDGWTDAIRGSIDVWRDCVSLSDEAAADLIVADKVDILVDCSGHMSGTRLQLFGLKPAPIQISHPIYPNTTGVETISYRVMDRYFAPPWVDAWHSESLIRLPDVYGCYTPLDDTSVPGAPPSAVRGYVTFASFNNLMKLGPSTIALWAKVLQAVPGARLALKWLGLNHHGAPWLMERFAAAGLERARIDIVPWTPHPYPPYRDVDICLDPLFANGGTTTCEALWMGVPVVTLPGRVPFSRVGLSYFANLGLDELIAKDADDYVRIAAALAADPSRLAAYRRTLRGRMAASPLMDGQRYARNVEAAYRRVWTDYCAGARPG